MKRYFLSIVILGISFCSWTQSYEDSIRGLNYDFAAPLNIDLVLAGNFGELRRNHFHTGLDFKTNHREGYKIYSIEEGYVSRIKVSPRGYGKVIYISHPEKNLTSVYAHLKGFPKNIDRFLKNAMIEQKKNEIDLYPGENQLFVNKGEVIGYSGNTGGSTAPHLHFEIRETVSEKPINPMLFGFNIKDNKDPYLFGIQFYTLDEKGYLTQERSPYYYFYNKSSKTITLPDHFVRKGDQIMVGVDANDYLDAAGNKCGVYEIILSDEKDTLYQMRLDRLSFENNRYINCHMDYNAYKEDRKNIHRCYVNPVNELDIYHHNKKSLFSLQKDKNYFITLIDVNGNKKQSSFKIDYKEDPTRKQNMKLLDPELPYFFEDENYSITIPSHGFYEPIPASIKKRNGKYGTELTFGSPEIPVHDYYDVALKPASNLPDIKKEKFCIFVKSERGYHKVYKTSYAGGYFRASLRDLGEIGIGLDTIPPKISTKNFTDGSQTYKSVLTFSIKDGYSGVSKYEAFIDGKWSILEFEPKRGGKYMLDVSSLNKGKHEVKIKAVDLSKNTASKVFYTFTK